MNGTQVAQTQSQNNSRQERLDAQALRKQVQALKSDVAMKENELLNTQMSTKFLRLHDLET